MANYSRWEDVKQRRPAISDERRGEVEQDLALGQLVYDLRTAAGLSQRESEIVALIAQGLSNAEVASRAYLSINSVKTHIRSAYRKMGVASRTQAVLWATEHGFRQDVSRRVLSR